MATVSTVPDDPNGLIEAVGRRIGDLRREQGATQQDFADEMGFSVQYLRRVESGEVNLTIHSLARFANALGVAVPELFRPPRSLRPRPRGRPPRKGGGD